MKLISVLLSAILAFGITSSEAQVTFNNNYQYTSVNNGTGGIVAIPIGQTGLTVNVATGSAALPLQNIANTTGAQHLYLGDDSSANVPLEFNFPFWGQTFSNSWMYSNGIVSFTSGNIPGAGCCGGQNLSTLRDTRYNYMIAPLWTDLIDTTGQSTWVLKNSNSATYGWYGTKEYGTNNSNSFEVNINSNGGMNVRYGSAFVSAGHTVTAGMTGNLANGEYFQYYHGQGFNIPTTNPVSWGTTGGYDLCLSNPLSSPSCPGYAQAYHDQQCSANPLYAPDCPGYAVAYHDQQCSVNPLYASDCVGYVQAYFDQQCSINPLYNRDCPGYAQAYYDQQCSINPLYDRGCTGYTQAYFNQQCSINALYDSGCPGYAQAYYNQQCTANPLYDRGCPGYAQAYFNQQCSISGLYDRQCPNYSTAYATQQVLQQQSVVTSPSSTTNTTTTSTTTSNTPTTTSTGTVQLVADTNVNNAITPPATTSATSATSVSPASPVSVVNTQPAATQTVTQQATNQSAPPPTQVAAQQEQKQEQTKTEQKVADTVEKKMEPSGGRSGGGSGGSKSDMKAAVAKVQKEIAKESQGAKTIESQVATQGLVVGAMNYVPGFDAYRNAIVPDINAILMAKQYEKPVVDNQRIQRRLSGANETKWQDMVNSQYKIGN